MRYLVLTATLAFLLLSGGAHDVSIARTAPAASAASERLQTRIFLVLDHATGAVVRKPYTVWDTAPTRGLEFEWVADVPSLKDPALVSGTGQLTWRERGKPSFDATAILSVYRGAMRAGRPHGRGELHTREGVRYEGESRNGLFDGQGSLQMAGGESYRGSFKAGKFDGEGTLVDASNHTYIGPFVAGRKQGRGRTRLPSGATFWSTWSMGVEDVRSRNVQLAQADPAPAGALQFAPDDVQFTFSVPSFRPVVPMLGYVARNEQDRVIVRPDFKKLMAAWKEGGSLTDFFVSTDMEYPPVSFAVRIANKSSQTIDIARARLEVDESLTDLQPVLVAHYVPLTGRGCRDALYFDTELLFHNFGWSGPRSTRLELDFARVPGDAPVERTSGEIPPAAWAKPNIAFDLESNLVALGVDTKRLRRWSEAMQYFSAGSTVRNKNRRSQVDDLLGCTKLTDRACLEKVKRTGAFGKLAPAVSIKDGVFSTAVSGRVSYTWSDAKGAAQAGDGTVRFDLRLGARKEASTPECGAAVDLDPVSGALIDLKLDQMGYQLPVPFKRIVGAGRTAQVNLLLRTKKSSSHRFRVVLETRDGRTIRSKDIDLLVFMSGRPEDKSARPVAEDPEGDAWKYVEHSRGGLGTFLRRFPKGPHAAEARAELATLQRQEVEALARVRKPMPRPGQVFRDCPECPEMIVVPAGRFMMGDTQNDPDHDSGALPRHAVSIKRNFAVGKFEVTFAEWDACVVARGCSHQPDDRGWGRGSRPVMNVTWSDAKQYIDWLSRRTGFTYRLLTEAEWEYAARAGSTTAFPWGATASHERANFDGAEGRDKWGIATAPVGQFPPNKFGLFDMLGNVWEWVDDCYADSYKGAPTDGTASRFGDCSRRVLRGGSWAYSPQMLRSAARQGDLQSGLRYNRGGFRVAVTR